MVLRDAGCRLWTAIISIAARAPYFQYADDGTKHRRTQQDMHLTRSPLFAAVERALILAHGCYDAVHNPAPRTFNKSNSLRSSPRIIDLYSGTTLSSDKVSATCVGPTGLKCRNAG